MRSNDPVEREKGAETLRKMSQEVLAEKIGVSRQSVSKYGNGLG